MINLNNTGSAFAAPGLAQTVPNGVKPRTAAAPAMQGFGATNNLIGQQLNPTNSAFTQGMQNTAQTAANQYANTAFTPFQGMGAMNFGAERGQLGQAQTQMQGLGYNFAPANSAYSAAQGQLAGLQALGAGNFGSGAASADFSGVNKALEGAAQGLDGPDRQQLALQAYQLMEDTSNSGFQRALRDTVAKNAAMGRRGSGITTNDLGDVQSQRDKTLANARRDTSLQAAAQIQQDKINLAMAKAGIAMNQADLGKFNASLQDAGLSRDQQGRQFGGSFQRGLVGDQMALGDRFSDQELARVGLGERQAGFTRGLANDSAGLTRDTWTSGQSERDAGRRDEFNRADFTRGRFTDFMGATQQGWGQDRSNRNELRDERGYQYGLSRDAVDDEYRRMDFEEGLRDRRFSRGLATTNFGFGAPSPVNAYGAAGAQAGAQSADGYGAAGMLLGQMGANRRRGGAGSGGGGGTPVASTYSSPAWG